MITQDIARRITPMTMPVQDAVMAIAHFGEDGWRWPYRARHRNRVHVDGRIAVHSYWQRH